MCFAVRCLLFWNLGEIILMGNAFNLSFFMIEVLLWSLACNGVLVANHDEWWIITVVLVKVLQCAIGCRFRISLSPRQIFRVWSARLTCLRVEKINDRQESSIQDCEDNPESPPEVLNPDRCNLNYNIVRDPVSSVSGTLKFHRTHHRSYQFVAVATAAPLVRIAMELISVG